MASETENRDQTVAQRTWVLLAGMWVKELVEGGGFQMFTMTAEQDQEAGAVKILFKKKCSRFTGINSWTLSRRTCLSKGNLIGTEHCWILFSWFLVMDLKSVNYNVQEHKNKKQTMGWWDGSAGKGACHQAWLLSSIPETQLVKRENWLLRVVLWLLCILSK